MTVKMKEITEAISQDRLVAVRFLSDAGRNEIALADHPCSDAKADGDSFAFFWAFASCAHGISVTRIENEGDEFHIFGSTGEQDVCVAVSPVWLDEQREILERWHTEKDVALVRRELERALQEPSIEKSHPAFLEDIVKGAVRVRGSYWAEYLAAEGALGTVGVLVAGKQRIVFRALPQHKALEAEVARKLAEYADRGFTAEDIFDYLVERANGVTRSLSIPARIEAKSIEDAAEQLLTKVGES